MTNIPQISAAEWEVMNVIWDKSPITANEAVAQLGPQHGWKDQTVRTMLGRLVRKGALAFEARGKQYFYTPKITREQSVSSETRSFVQRVFGGEANPLFAHFVNETLFSQEEIEELKRLLDQKKDNR